MARKLFQSGVHMTRSGETITRLCTGAIKIDPNYADAWALLGMTQAMRATFYGGTNSDGLEAVNRALQLNNSLSFAHCAKARVLWNLPDPDGASNEIEVALRLDPESFETNSFAGLINYLRGKTADAMYHWNKCAAAPDAGFWLFQLLMMAHVALRDMAAAQAVAKLVLGTSQKLLAQEPDNGLAMGSLAEALAVLGEPERAREMVNRAMLLAPDNSVAMVCLVRALVLLGDHDAALDIFEHVGRNITRQFVGVFTVAPDLKPMRDSPRFAAILASIQTRLT